MKSYKNIALLCNNYISYYFKLVPCSGKTKHGHAVVKVWMSFWDEVLVCGHRNIWSRVRTCHIIHIVNVHWVKWLISLIWGKYSQINIQVIFENIRFFCILMWNVYLEKWFKRNALNHQSTVWTYIIKVYCCRICFLINYVIMLLAIFCLH